MIIKEKGRKASITISFPQAASQLILFANQLQYTSLYHGPGLLRLGQHDEADPPELHYCNNVDMCQPGILQFVYIVKRKDLQQSCEFKSQESHVINISGLLHCQSQLHGCDLGYCMFDIHVICVSCDHSSRTTASVMR